MEFVRSATLLLRFVRKVTSVISINCIVYQILFFASADNFQYGASWNGLIACKKCLLAAIYICVLSFNVVSFVRLFVFLLFVILPDLRSKMRNTDVIGKWDIKVIL